MHFFPPKKMGGNVCASYGANMERPAWNSRRRCVRIPGWLLGSSVLLGPTCSSVQCCPYHLLSPVPASLVWAPSCDSLQLHSWVPTAHEREALHFENGPAVFWDLTRRRRLRGGGTTPRKWERVPSLTISCTVSAVSGHFLHRVRSLWSSPVPCPQSLVISCTVSAVSGHLLYRVRSL
ncbi:unnamed protein product [Staurois parvus]|uniref:Uncharacterized protein n=1 Tax=Staurois parvus TaxID=386267 RepID=A0ABN9CKR2_9NEOB|nr:unnamed protein product [Staurois parvus]